MNELLGKYDDKVSMFLYWIVDMIDLCINHIDKLLKKSANIMKWYDCSM